jgi:hypothetical protein
MSLVVLAGDGLTEEAIIAEAYAHVAESYRRALEVTGLPTVEREDLTGCLRVAARIAHERPLTCVGGDV